MFKGLCRVCKHFVNRKRGKSGGLKGMCEYSRTGRYNYEHSNFLRPCETRKKCSRFEEEVKP